MASKDIGESIAALDPDQINWSDPNAYAAMGIGEDEVDGEGDSTQGDTAAQASAPAAAATPAPAAPAVAATPAAPAASSATPGTATATPTDDARPAGIATRDGKQVIPYAVLEATRRDLKAATEREQHLKDQLAQAVANAAPQGTTLTDKAVANPDSLTDDELNELAADFPQLAKPLRILRQAAEKVAEVASRPTAQAAPAPSPTAQGDHEQEAFDAGLAANPLLAQWMGSAGKEWQRATQLDKVLMADPDNKALTYTQRFAKVQAMVAAEFGIATPASAPQPAKPAVPATPRAAPMPGLSDIGGTAPLSSDEDVDSTSMTDLLARAEHMSDADLRRFAGIGY